MERSAHVRHTVPPVRKRRRRTLDERLALRLPGLASRVRRWVLGLPPRSRVRRAVMPLADRNNHEALNRRDWEVAFMNFDADVRFRIASGRENWAPDMDEEYRGPDGMQRAMEQFDEAWHEWQLDTGELIDLGERHVCLCRYHATGRSSGARVDHPVAHVITIRDRRIVAMDFYWDQSEALEAVGLPDGGA